LASISVYPEVLVIAAISRARALVICVLLLFAGTTAGWAQVPVTTWHYDNARTGQNPNETILTPQNVNPKQFGKLFTQPVDGQIIGQALYLPQVTIPGAGVHNVVYVATMNDSVYAFDADSASGSNANPLWHTTFLINGAVPVPIKLQGCGGSNFWTQVGIVSTMVIDSETLYVVAKTYENSNFVYRLHALNVTNGLEQAGSPIVITASYVYEGTTYVFNPKMQVNRPALLLENGYVYIAMGSNGCRSGKEEGWVLSYNASSLQAAGVFDDEPGESAAAVWMRGGGLSADSSGNIYGTTADGPFKAGIDFGQSVFKLSQSGNTLELADWFTPYNELYLDDNDLDISNPVLVLPTQGGPNPNLLATIGKEGTLYILNQSNLGHFCATCTVVSGDTNIPQELTTFAPEGGALVYWNNAIYTSATGAPIMGVALTNGVLATVPFAQSKKVDSGHSPVISANGNAAGVLWQITGNSLSAFNALTLVRIYNSGQAAHDRDVLPRVPNFANHVVANGKVYVGTNNSLVAFGLL
jgi:hypothetical protein